MHEPYAKSLDRILEAIVKEPNGIGGEDLVSVGMALENDFKVQEFTFHNMLRELDRIEMIDYNEKDGSIIIRFLGQDILQQGGFLQIEMNKREAHQHKVVAEKRTERNEVRLIVVTGLAAIGAIGLVLWESRAVWVPWFCSC